MLSFKLFENIQQAKKLLQNKKVKDFTDFDEISNLLNKNTNYIYQFTKWRYVDGASMEDIRKVINVIKNNKNVIDLLDKDLIQYKNFEKLIDDLAIARSMAIVNKFLTEVVWYKSLRDKVKDYIKDNPEKSNIILEFLKLDQILQSEFLSSLKFYETNNVSAESFFDSLENFITKKGLGSEELLNKLKEQEGLLDIVYNKDNVIIITTRDRSVVKQFGSEKWCIVYSENYFGTYIGDVATQQYICYNLNIPKTNYNHMFGITVYPDGVIKSGARQNMNNKSMEMVDIVKSLNVGADIFKPLNDEELSKLPPINLISSGLIRKLTKEQISKLTITQKLKHHLLTEEEKQGLDPEDKVFNGFISYLTEDDIKELPEHLIEKYEIPLSEDDIKIKNQSYKARNGYFKYLNDDDINEINDIVSKDFKTYEEVEQWYKSLNLIEKLDIINNEKQLEFFISKKDLLPFEDKYDCEITDDSLGDSLYYNTMEDIIEYKGSDIYYSDIIDVIGLSSDYSYNAFSGYRVDLYGSEEEWYSNSYINKENLKKINELFGLEEDDLRDRFNFKFLVEFFLGDYYFLSDIEMDMNNKGNRESDKFLSQCPIKISGGNDTIGINISDLLNYLKEYKKTEYVNLFDWADSDTLFDSDKIDWYTLNEYQPYPSTEEETYEFNYELGRKLSNFEDDVDKEVLRRLPQKLLKLGFIGDENNRELSMTNDGNNNEIIITSIDSREVIDEDDNLVQEIFIEFTKNSVEMSGNLDYLKASITQGELFKKN